MDVRGRSGVEQAKVGRNKETGSLSQGTDLIIDGAMGLMIQELQAR